MSKQFQEINKCAWLYSKKKKKITERNRKQALSQTNPMVYIIIGHRLPNLNHSLLMPDLDPNSQVIQCKVLSYKIIIYTIDKDNGV